LLEGQSTRLGSGFVYDNQGHVVTNNHVVGGAKTVDVTFVDVNVYSAKVIGTDPFSDIAVLQITDGFSEQKVSPSDIAVLQITDGFSEQKVSPIPNANSSQIEVGDQVLAIGNPFGLSNTMTTGIVSQKARLLPIPTTRFSIPNGIQTDAAINPGNSGGHLLNMQGQVIEMNTAISSSNGVFSGVGFAIRSNTITHIVPELI
jgi:S1-C subfamily serine protease